MSPTPRTDANTWRAHCGDGDSEDVVSAHIAQQLETELAEEKALTDKLLHDASYVGGVLYWVQKHDAVLAQLAEARAEVIALKEELESHAWEISPAMAQAKIDQLKAEVERLREDKARLDWLEKTDGEVHSDMGAGDGPSTWFAYRKRGNVNDTQFECFSAPTVRESIDAARKGTPDEPFDRYGNTEADPKKFCTFPDCGCDGARLCDARSGPNHAACVINVERGGTP
jgi:hypothetical protein